ncbi:hypothetical protein HK405_004047, partial [Cladochytrium tenue]
AVCPHVYLRSFRLAYTATTATTTAGPAAAAVSSHVVVHIHYTAWTDTAVPAHPDELLASGSLSRRSAPPLNHRSSNRRDRFWHCSAGLWWIYHTGQPRTGLNQLAVADAMFCNMHLACCADSGVGDDTTIAPDLVAALISCSSTSRRPASTRRRPSLYTDPAMHSSPGSSPIGSPPWSPPLSLSPSAPPSAPRNDAQVACPLSTVVFLLNGGGLTNFHDIAYPFVIIKWISPVAYAFRANMINEFSGLNDFSCDGAATPTSCITSGDAVLAYYSANDIPYGTSAGALVALFAGFSFLENLLLHKPRSSRMAAK